MLQHTSKFTQKSLLRLLRSTVVDASLGAVCGGLYGFIFGGLGNLAGAEADQLVTFAAAFAVCGALSGALIGARGLIPQAGNTTTNNTGSVSELIDQQTASPTTRLRFATRIPAQPPVQIAG